MSQSQSQTSRPLPQRLPTSQPDLLLQQPLQLFHPEDLTLDPDALEDVDLLLPDFILQPPIPQQSPEQIAALPQIALPNSNLQRVWEPQRAMTQQELFSQNMHTLQQNPQQRAMPQRTDDEEFFPDFVDDERAYPGAGR